MTRFFPVSQPSIGPLEIEYVGEAVRSGWISSLGPFVDRFETEFAAFCGTEHAVSVSNGTVAIHLTLVALGIGAGDEVIVPDLSFIATANAVLMAGATPVFADIDPVSLCLDPDAIAPLVTPRTKAVMPVHLYGHPADMDAINTAARRLGLIVIEDAAEAHGAEWNGRRVGGLGHAATFSFYGNKNLTTGEGGMITTNDAELAQRLRFLRDHAMSKGKRYWHTELGYNYRLTNLQAALGCAQLKRADEMLDRRRAIYARYAHNLGQHPTIRLNRSAAMAKHSYWMICAEFEGLDEARREDLMAALREAGVDTRPYFFPMSAMPYLTSADTPQTHRVFPRGLNLPTYIDLSDQDIDTISATVTRCWEEMGSDA